MFHAKLKLSYETNNLDYHEWKTESSGKPCRARAEALEHCLERMHRVYLITEHDENTIRQETSWADEYEWENDQGHLLHADMTWRVEWTTHPVLILNRSEEQTLPLLKDRS